MMNPGRSSKAERRSGSRFPVCYPSLCPVRTRPPPACRDRADPENDRAPQRRAHAAEKSRRENLAGKSGNTRGPRTRIAHADRGRYPWPPGRRPAEGDPFPRSRPSVPTRPPERPRALGVGDCPRPTTPATVGRPGRNTPDEKFFPTRPRRPCWIPFTW